MSQHLKLLLDYPLVIAAIFISGIGGTFQYGFSVSVMTSPSEFIKDLVNQTCLERYNLSLEKWQLSLIWSFTVSIFCIGGLIGSLTVGSLISKHGRKRCLLLNNFVAISGALLMLLSKQARSFEMIMVGRFLYGFNAGVGVSAHAMYMGECAPVRLRGMVGVTVATSTSFGKFVGQLLGISELLGTEDRWPWLLGFNGFTALLQLVTLPFLPESPSFLLLNRGDYQACDQALKRLRGNKDYTQEVENIMKEKTAMQNVCSYSLLEFIRDKSVRWQLLTIITTFVGMQMCGINAVYFYSFDVFHAAGIQEDQLSYAALGTGLCELITSFACFMIIESMGRKALIFRGFMNMSATLVLLTITLYLQSQVSWLPYCSMALILLFILFFSSGPAGAIVSLPGEILTQPLKSAGYTLACILSWTGLFTLGMVFPVIVENLGPFCFLIFLVFCMVSGLFVRFNIPETKNKTVLEVTAEFQRMHMKKSQMQICETRF